MGIPLWWVSKGAASLKISYGQDAEAMLSQPATKLFFKTTEPRAAKWISDAIREIEVERLKESRSMRLLGSRKSYAMEIATKPLVMASEISGSNHCTASSSRRTALCRFTSSSQGSTADNPSSSNASCRRLRPGRHCRRWRRQPAQSNPDHRQRSKPHCHFFDAPAEQPTDKPKEAFVWDESKGIE